MIYKNKKNYKQVDVIETKKDMVLDGYAYQSPSYLLIDEDDGMLYIYPQEEFKENFEKYYPTGHDVEKIYGEEIEEE
jgi:hypothetical protein